MENGIVPRRVKVFPDTRRWRKRVWRRRRERHIPGTVIPGSISWRRSLFGPRFHLLPRQTWSSMKATGADTILSVTTCATVLRQMPDAVPIFLDDNAKPYRARIIDDFLQANN